MFPQTQKTMPWQAAPPTSQEERDAQELWQNIQEPQNHDLPEASDEVRQLLEVSAAVYAMRDDAAEMARLEIESQTAFASSHTRLMAAVDADVALRNVAQNATSAREMAAHDVASRRVFRWNRVLDWKLFGSQTTWRIAAFAALLVTALGGHSVGYNRAVQKSQRDNVSQNRATKDAAPKTADTVVRVLPVQALVDDFDSGLRSDTPFEFVADERETAPAAAKRLQNKLGVALHLPLKPRSGARLLGARRHTHWKRAGVQAHYEQNGVRVAVYQMREPSCALGDLREVEMNGRLFMTGKHGAYRVVAWRAGDDVMTMVSPLAMQQHESLLLADDMRHVDTLT